MKINIPRAVLVLAVVLGLIASALPGQPLYLLKGAIRPTGSSEPWRSEILQVDEHAGRLTVARDLGTDKFKGIAFCLVNYEHRVVVIGVPSFEPNTFVVVDMDNVQSPNVLRPDFSSLPPISWDPYPVSPNARIRPVSPKKVYAGGGAALLFSTNLGLVLSLDVFGPNGTADYAFPIQKGAPAPARGLSRFDRGAFISSGALGVGFYAQGSTETVSPYESTLKLNRRVAIDLGVPSPSISPAVTAVGKPFRLHINDGHSLVLRSLAKGTDSTKLGDGSSTLHVRDKRNGRWHTLTVPGDMPYLRSVGKYLLGVARTEDFKRERESAGKAEFEELTKNVRWQDGVAASSAHWEAYYPGILFAIDVETGKMFRGARIKPIARSCGRMTRPSTIAARMNS